MKDGFYQQRSNQRKYNPDTAMLLVKIPLCSKFHESTVLLEIRIRMRFLKGALLRRRPRKALHGIPQGSSLEIGAVLGAILWTFYLQKLPKLYRQKLSKSWLLIQVRRAWRGTRTGRGEGYFLAILQYSGSNFVNLTVVDKTHHLLDFDKTYPLFGRGHGRGDFLVIMIPTRDGPQI